jgi:hypothetical protein
MIVSRACDVYACDAAQAAGLMAGGEAPNPGAIVTDWIADIRRKMRDPNAQWRLLSGIGTVATQCTAASSCTVSVARGNHIRWPDGLAMGDGGRDSEPSMLYFLRTHPHPNP